AILTYSGSIVTSERNPAKRSVANAGISRADRCAIRWDTLSSGCNISGFGPKAKPEKSAEFGTMVAPREHPEGERRHGGRWRAFRQARRGHLVRRPPGAVGKRHAARADPWAALRKLRVRR